MDNFDKVIVVILIASSCCLTYIFATQTNKSEFIEQAGMVKAECEASLPRDQHCRYVITAEVINDSKGAQ